MNRRQAHPYFTADECIACQVKQAGGWLHVAAEFAGFAALFVLLLVLLGLMW